MLSAGQMAHKVTGSAGRREGGGGADPQSGVGRETGSRAGEGSCYAVGGYAGQKLKWVRNVLAACARLGKGVAGAVRAGLESACGGLCAGE